MFDDFLGLNKPLKPVEKVDIYLERLERSLRIMNLANDLESKDLTNAYQKVAAELIDLISKELKPEPQPEDAKN